MLHVTFEYGKRSNFFTAHFLGGFVLTNMNICGVNVHHLCSCSVGFELDLSRDDSVGWDLQ